MRKLCISKDTVFARPRPILQPCTPKLLDEVMALPHVGYYCGQLRSLSDALDRGDVTPKEYAQRKSALKRNLPFWTPMASFANGQRKLRDEHGALNALPSGLVMIDVDHEKDPRALFERIRPRLAQGRVALVHITPSWRGLRIVFEAQSPNVESAVAQESELLGLGGCDVDKACKDLSRASFIVAPSMVLFRDDTLLFADAPVLAPEQAPTLKAYAPASPSAKAYNGVPYATIIDEWFKRNGRPVEGNRNNQLFRLACQLRYICDDNEELIISILPPFGLGEGELRQIVHHACTEAYRKETPKPMLAAIAAARVAAAGLLMADDDDPPPALPQRLPALMELLLSRTPEVYRPAVACAVFPALGAHLYNTWFRYLDGELHEATLMNCLMAPTGAGKSCINKPIEAIMADIELRDKAALIAEDEWKEQVRTLGSNEQKPQRPKVCVQEISPDITPAAFVLRLKQAGGHFLFSRLNEIDQFDALKNGKLNEQFLIMCLAFDPNNRFGQTRVGADAVSSQVCVRYNWVASTTVANGMRYFSKVLTNGPISRINFSTIPEREIGAEMPVYGIYDDDFRIALLPYINRLTSAGGEVVCQPAQKLAKRLLRHCSDRAVLSQSRVYENLSFRALVIAYIKACVLYVANGMKWEPEIESFAQWSLDYDLWCKMRFFGQAIANEEEAAEPKKRGCKSLLDFLPDRFTLPQVVELRKARGMKPEGEKKMVSNWVNRKFIHKINESTYEKLKTCS